MATYTINTSVNYGPQGVSASSWSSQPANTSVSTTVQPSYIPVVQPPINSTQFNTGTSTGSTAGLSGQGAQLAQALLEIIAAIDPQAAPAIQQVESALGLSSGSAGGTGSTGTGGNYGTSAGTGGGTYGTSYSTGGGTYGTSYSTGGYSSGTGGSGGTYGTSYSTGGYSSGSIGSSSGTGTYVSTGTGGSSTLAQNKAAVIAAAKAQGLSQQKIDTILTIGSIETNDMSASERDSSKDGTDSENYSAFNLNKGMLQAMGYNPDTGPNLNDPANVGVAVNLMSQAMDKYGVNGFLAWQRGGQQGYQDGTSYDVQGYINAVNSGVATLQSNSALLTNDSRIPTPALSHE